MDETQASNLVIAGFAGDLSDISQLIYAAERTTQHYGTISMAIGH